MANAFFAATVVLLLLGSYLLRECTFLIPFRQVLYHHYGGRIAGFAALLFFNLFAGFYLVTRKLFLKDTGKKLRHVEKQLRTGSAVLEELGERLKG